MLQNFWGKIKRSELKIPSLFKIVRHNLDIMDKNKKRFTFLALNGLEFVGANIGLFLSQRQLYSLPNGKNCKLFNQNLNDHTHFLRF